MTLMLLGIDRYVDRKETAILTSTTVFLYHQTYCPVVPAGDNESTFPDSCTPALGK